MIAVVAVVALAFTATAQSAPHVYAGPAVLPANSSFVSPALSFVPMNWTRMSIDHPRRVEAVFYRPSGAVQSWWDPDYFVQNPVSLSGGQAAGGCLNTNSVNVYGYCAWYD